MEEKVLEEKKNIINNLDAINVMIEYINKALVNEQVIPEPHGLESYFLTGHCNIYAKILVDIFGDDAMPYDNNDHIITKIGEEYYDVNGFYPRFLVDETFRESPKEYLCEKMFGLGNYDSRIDDRIIEVGVAAGNQYIESRVLEREKSI